MIFSHMGIDRLMDISSEASKSQTPIGGHFSHNVNSFNTTTIINNHGIRVPKYVPSMQLPIANLHLKLMAKNLCSDL